MELRAAIGPDDYYVGYRLKWISHIIDLISTRQNYPVQYGCHVST